MDDVLILSKGNVFYYGPRENTINYFEGLGYHCPTHTNPADFFLDITSVDLRSAEAEEKSKARVRALTESYDSQRNLLRNSMDQSSSSITVPPPAVRVKTLDSASSVSTLPSSRSLAVSEDMLVVTRDKERAMAPFTRSFPLLVRRAFQNIIRSPAMTSARLSQVSGFGLILLLFYCRIGDDYYSVQNRIGLLYEAIAPILFTGMLNCIAVFPTERNVFYREKADGTYSSEAFLASYMVNEIPFELVTTMVYTSIVMPAIGLQHTPDRFFSFFFVIWCLVFSGESFGIIFCGIFYQIGFSVTVTSVVLSAFCGMTGLISINLPEVLQVINHVSIIKYATEFAAINEFTGLTFTCTASQQLSDGSCPYTTGSQVLSTYNYDPRDKWLCFGLIILLTAVYRGIAFLTFKFIKRKFSQ